MVKTSRMTWNIQSEWFNTAWHSYTALKFVYDFGSRSSNLRYARCSWLYCFLENFKTITLYFSKQSGWKFVLQIISSALVLCVCSEDTLILAAFQIQNVTVLKYILKHSMTKPKLLVFMKSRKFCWKSSFSIGDLEIFNYLRTINHQLKTSFVGTGKTWSSWDPENDFDFIATFRYLEQNLFENGYIRL